MQAVYSRSLSASSAIAATGSRRDGCRPRAQLPSFSPLKRRQTQQKLQGPNPLLLQTAGGLAALQLAFTGAASAHYVPQLTTENQVQIVQQHTMVQPVADTAGFFDFLGTSNKESQDASKQLQGTGGQNFNEKGGPTPSKKEGKELSKGYATGSSSLPVPDVGGDVDTSGFKNLNKKPEEGTLSKAGEKSPVPGKDI